MVTEPHTVAGKITGMPAGTKIIAYKTTDRNQPGPRAGIIASRDLKVNTMESWCNRDCAVGIFKMQGKQVVLVSAYLDIKEPAVPDWLETLMDMLQTRKLPVILSIDSNAHSSLYGPDNNSRGDEFEDFILKHGLEVHNQGSVPTYQTQRGDKLIQTHIDVTLSRDLHFRIDNWRVDQTYNASDHNNIYFETVPNITDKIRVRPWSKANWTLFTEKLSTADYKIPSSMNMKKLDRLTSHVYKILNQALDEACPEITVSESVKTNTWATEKHEKAKEKVTALYDKAKTTNCPNTWQDYKKADADFKKMCRTDRNKAWREYKESLQTEKDMASLAKLAQREDRQEIGVLNKEDGSTSTPGKETIELLTNTHFPAATNRQHVTYNNRKACLTTSLEDKYTEWITTHLIKQALDGFEKKKSPGPDGIKPLIFSHLPSEFIATLEVLYKSCIHLGYTPKLWKATKVIFISKPGKDTYAKPKSFRPISLSNYFLKGLERLVAWKMDLAFIDYPIQ